MRLSTGGQKHHGATRGQAVTLIQYHDEFDMDIDGVNRKVWLYLAELIY